MTRSQATMVSFTPGVVARIQDLLWGGWRPLPRRRMIYPVWHQSAEALAWRAQKRAYTSGRQRAYYCSHRDQILAQQARYRRTPRYRRLHAEYMARRRKARLIAQRQPI